MSGVGSHGTFIHLFLNGVYWGVYNLVERPDDEFQAEYFDGSDDDWFYTNHGGAGSADSTRWDYLIGPLTIKDMDEPANYAELQEYLNVEHFADYMILNFWIGMTDWPINNWYVANRNDASDLGPTPSEFFAWDGEWSLDRKQGLVPEFLFTLFPEAKPPGADIRSEFVYNTGSTVPILKIWHSLFDSPDFRALLDERVALHTSAGGASTDEAAIERWDGLNAHVESAIVGESARWGDSLTTLGGKFSVTRTRDVDWKNHVDKIRDLLSGNTEQFLDEYSRLVSPSLLSVSLFPVGYLVALLNMIFTSIVYSIF